jgi:hypothetical protein
MAKKQTETRANKKTIIILIVTMIFAAIASCCIYIAADKLHPKDEPTSNSEDEHKDDKTPEESYSPSDEKTETPADDPKARMDEDEANKTVPEKDESGLNIARPEISFIATENDKIAIGGAIPNINEVEGNCTFVLTNGAQTVTETSGILPNPSYISCESVQIDKSRLSSGTWTIKIQYKSKTSEGESEPKTYTIQ